MVRTVFLAIKFVDAFALGNINLQMLIKTLPTWKAHFVDRSKIFIFTRP